jgi:hypothetical protein
MRIIENFIGNLKVGDAQEFNGLMIRPIFTGSDYALPFLTLGEALDKNVLEITEKSESGSVPELFVKNTGKQDVIVLEGEELRGAKQNRVINTTIIIPAGGEILLPVSCVEQGRWHYSSRSFSSGENVMSPSLRKYSHDSVSYSLRTNRSYDSDQGGIWSNIRDKFERMSVSSGTQAMSDITDASITPETEKSMLEEIWHQPNQIGFLAYIKGGFAGGDLFGSSQLCEKQMRKMLRGYYLDALDAGVEFPAVEAEEILAQVARANHERFDAIGKGAEMRFEAETVQGAWKLVDETVSHLTVFPRE